MKLEILLRPSYQDTFCTLVINCCNGDHNFSERKTQLIKNLLHIMIHTFKELTKIIAQKETLIISNQRIKEYIENQIL